MAQTEADRKMIALREAYIVRACPWCGDSPPTYIQPDDLSEGRRCACCDWQPDKFFEASGLSYEGLVVATLRRVCRLLEPRTDPGGFQTAHRPAG